MNTDAMKSVKELAVQIPGAAPIFEKLGIDYCCGGNLSLTEACAKANVSVENVLASLKSASSERRSNKDWSRAPLAALARHIVDTHHTYTLTETERLEKLFAKVCEVHGKKHPELLRMRAIFRDMSNDLRMHLMKEEHILFPYIAEMEQATLQKTPVMPPAFGTLKNPVRNMMKEHDSAGEALRELREESSNYAPPQDACVTYRELYRSLEAFEADLHQHVHLENNILFPRAIELESAPSASAQAAS
jgi:regulator of cell morphogenesis and NO signaling